ncbi:MAG: DUF4390 domain-containing protein [Burkholderiaceae bacterium]|nr:MAG: DUF4390 domain-containing protein [Burkholderiaceae bacterium]
MRRATTVRQTPRAAWIARSVRCALARWAWWLAACLALGVSGVAHNARAQGVELGTLQLRAADGALTLEFNARLSLSRAVEDALQRGVPMYFDVDATLFRARWYWRDERVSEVSRSYRLSYQPLTGNWRVGLGALGQSYPTLAEALAVISSVSGWRLADASQLEAGQRYYVEFRFRLDASKLPQPLQIGIGNEWTLGLSRVLKVDEALIDAVHR